MYKIDMCRCVHLLSLDIVYIKIKFSRYDPFVNTPANLFFRAPQPGQNRVHLDEKYLEYPIFDIILYKYIFMVY